MSTASNTKAPARSASNQTKSAAERIVKARMGIILGSPFWGALLMRLTMIRNDAVDTFCTNGSVIYYNEAFAQSLNDDELKGVLVHEVCHCAQGHLWRMGERNAEKWNYACDYQINLTLTDFVADEKAAFEKKHGSSRYVAPWALPTGGLLDEQYRGMAAEEIYNRLPDPPTGQSYKVSVGVFIGPGNAEPQLGNGSDHGNAPTSGSGSGSGPATAEDWKIAVTQAVAAARIQGQGTIPASIERMLGDLLEPKVPWRQVLREFIREKSRDDYSWSHPNRRYASRGFVLPSLYTERMGRIIIGVDTSGSIGPKELSEFQAEIQAALDECQPEAVEIIYCDAAVNGVDEFTPGDAVRLRPIGGGGTDFRPVFDHVAEQCDPPVCLIYLTDGYGTFPEEEPEYPVLWATTALEKYPFGTVVSIK